MSYNIYAKGLGFLQSYSDTPCGRGTATFTLVRSRARKFPTRQAAFAFWQQQSTTVPTRADGKPNRPLTGYPMCEILRHDATPIISII